MMENSTSPPRTQNNVTFEALPDVVLGKIMSFLHWKEKELLALASSRIQFLLESPLAWEYFENNRNYAFNNLFKFMQFSFLMEQEIGVIRQYGKYFQRCKLWLYSMDLDLSHRNNPEWDPGSSILRTVSVHCRQLRWLCVVHPSDISLGHLQHSFDYIKSLQDISFRETRKCSLSLRNLFYSSMDLSHSVMEKYMCLLESANLIENISCLDISHGVISGGARMSVSCFELCSNIVTLKCPIHAVDTDVIIKLCNQKLVSLYLVSDEHTKDLSLLEKSFLDWVKIYNEIPAKTRNRLEVHYIFQNVTVDIGDFVPNPFVKSVILNNLTCSITAILLHAMAETYGPSLENLAFCSNYWEFLMHFTDLHEINNSLAYVGKTCKALKTFISCLKLSSSAISSLVINSKTLRNVHVYKNCVVLSMEDKPVSRFQDKISRLMGVNGAGWNMVEPGENIFDVPSINPMLFDTCFNSL